MTDKKTDKGEEEIPVVGAFERLPHLCKIHFPECKIHKYRAEQQPENEFEVILFNHNMSLII
jgi:hypothetical protein